MTVVTSGGSVPDGPGLRYGDFLGVGPANNSMLDYVRRSHEIEIRVNAVRCYLLQQLPAGSIVGSLTGPTGSILVTSNMWVNPNPPAYFNMWNGLGPHPDLRPYIGQGDGGIFVWVNGQSLTRVLSVNDLRNSSQFAVVKRFDIDPQPVEIHFHQSLLNPTGSTVQFSFETMFKDIRPTAINRPEGNQFSLFGWKQYKTCSDDYHGANQVLIRMPMVTRDKIKINEEGKISIEENMCWTTHRPYIGDTDILVVTSDQSPIGETLYFEVVNKLDSIIREQLMSQRFKVNLLSPEDERTKIPISTVYP